MRKGAILMFALSAALVLAVSADAQPPTQPKEGKGRPGAKGRPGGFPGGPGGFTRPQPGQVLPVFLQERLKLSEEQKQQVADLQKEVDEKIGKILTAEQKEQLKQMRERGPGRGFGGPDRGPGRGGFGGDRGKGPRPDARPPVNEKE